MNLDYYKPRFDWINDEKLTNIYFISMVGHPSVKIGKAKDPVSRMEQLQISAPEGLKLLTSFRSPWQMETALHWHFRNQRARGEWFSPCSKMVEIMVLADAEEYLDIVDILKYHANEHVKSWERIQKIWNS